MHPTRGKFSSRVLHKQVRLSAWHAHGDVQHRRSSHRQTVIHMRRLSGIVWQSGAAAGRDAEECLPCPTNTSTERAAYTIADCLCDKGSHYTVGGGACAECPRGADCSARSMALSESRLWVLAIDATAQISSMCDGTQGADRNDLADQCCPGALCTATSSDAYCKKPLRTAPCMQGRLCEAPGAARVQRGASAALALVVIMLVFRVLCFLAMILYFQCDARRREGIHNAGRGKYVVGQAKIMIGYLQVLTAISTVYARAPFPKFLVDYISFFNIVNVDVFYLFPVASCRLNVRFLDRFALHMGLLPLLIVAAMCAHAVHAAIQKQNTEETRAVRSKVITFIILLLYPAWQHLASRSFAAQACSPRRKTQTFFLDEDEITCFGSTHAVYISIAVVFMLLYCAGIPVVVFFILRRNRNKLFDTKAEGHADTLLALGGLYQQYEEPYWYFQVPDMLMRISVAGALCLIAEGPTQIVIGRIMHRFWLLLIVKTAPYVHVAEDLARISATLALTLTSLISLCFVMDGTGEERYFSHDVLGAMLVIINTACLLHQFVLFIAEARNEKRSKSKSALHQVVPAKDSRSDEAASKVQSDKIVKDAKKDVDMRNGSAEDEIGNSDDMIRAEKVRDWAL